PPLNREARRHVTALKVNAPRPSEPAVFERQGQDGVDPVRGQQELLRGLVVEPEPQGLEGDSVRHLLPGFIVGLQVLRSITRIGADEVLLGGSNQIERGVARRNLSSRRDLLGCGSPQAGQDRRESHYDGRRYVCARLEVVRFK